MKRLVLSAAAMGLGIAALAPVAASAQTSIPTRPVWSSVDETVGLGNFFSQTWEATYSGTVYITDLYVPGDGYNIYKNGAEVAANVLGTDCAAIGGDACDVDGSYYAYNGEQGWASPYFAHWSGGASAGDLFTIQVAALPTGFSDSTVAISESAVPEPATWAMMLVGFAGLGFAGYRKARPTVAVA